METDCKKNKHLRRIYKINAMFCKGNLKLATISEHNLLFPQTFDATNRNYRVLSISFAVMGGYTI